MQYLRQDMGLKMSYVPLDFLNLASLSMELLSDSNKDNVVYQLSKALGVKRPDGRPRMPIDRMPFGLLAYNIKFFTLEDVSNLHATPDYVEWQTTMFSHFGQKWDRLHRGPMLSFDKDENKNALDLQHDKIVKDDVLSVAIAESFGESGVSLVDNDCATISCTPSVQESPSETGVQEEIHLSTVLVRANSRSS
jgi:hypothetical protein